MAVLDPELVIDHLQHRRNRVGGAGGCAQNVITFGNVAMVYAVNNILDRAFAWSRQDDLGRHRGISDVVQGCLRHRQIPVLYNHQGIVNAVFGVVDLGG